VTPAKFAVHPRRIDLMLDALAVLGEEQATVPRDGDVVRAVEGAVLRRPELKPNSTFKVSVRRFG
jgi:hypothetical protein